MKNLIKKHFTRIWSKYTYSLKDQVILNEDLIREAITNFFETHVNKISDMEHIIVLFRIVSVNNHVFTIGNLQKIGKNDLEFYVRYINNVLYFKSDEYREEVIKSFIFSFGVREGEIKKKNKLDYLTEKNKPIYQSYKNYKIPATMNPKKYGKLLGSHIEDGKIIYYIQITPLSLAKIKYSDLDKNEVEIIKDGMTVLKYTDYWIDENKFKRVIGENKEATFYFTRTGEFELFTI